MISAMQPQMNHVGENPTNTKTPNQTPPQQ